MMTLDEGLVITGPSGSIRGHRNRVINSVQKIGYLSSSAATSSCSTFSASDADSDASSCSFSDTALSFTNSSSSDSSAVNSFEDSDVIRALRDKWQRKKNESDSGCSTNHSSRADDDKEGDKVLLYTTSIGVIRSTFEASNKLRAILDQNFIRFEERDLFLDESFRGELKHKSAMDQVSLPCVFVNGMFFGALADIESMNEMGILRHILPLRVSSSEAFVVDDCSLDQVDKTKKYVVDKKLICGACGGARFIPCTKCNGSTKSCVLRFPIGRHSLVSLKCSLCSRGTGLIRCPLCFTSSRTADGIKLPSIVFENNAEN